MRTSRRAILRNKQIKSLLTNTAGITKNNCVSHLKIENCAHDSFSASRGLWIPYKPSHLVSSRPPGITDIFHRLPVFLRSSNPNIPQSTIHQDCKSPSFFKRAFLSLAFRSVVRCSLFEFNLGELVFPRFWLTGRWNSHSGETTKANNACMSITCQFSKRIGLLPGKDTDKAEAWGTRLLDFLSLTGWNTPVRIISDRDSKFLAGIWRAIFARLQTRLLMTTAWHPQADGQSERTNQTVEIAMRFAADDQRYVDWEDAIPALVRAYNSSTNSTTGYTPDELCYGF
jgi:hypothetical protein